MTTVVDELRNELDIEEVRYQGAEVQLVHAVQSGVEKRIVNAAKRWVDIRSNYHWLRNELDHH